MDLLEQFESQTPAEYRIRSEEALRWYQQQMRAVRINAREFYRTSGLRKTRRILTGRFYTYYYEPKYADTLPYYDIFPVVLILAHDSNSFMGLNFHYIPPRYRVLLLKELYDYATKDDEDADDMTTYIRITYEILRSAKKFRWAKPCLKRYRIDHVIGPALEVTPDHWDSVAMLPLARFKKKNIQQVYQESRVKAFE